jgi:hypothetical protein
MIKITEVFSYFTCKIPLPWNRELIAAIAHQRNLDSISRVFTIRGAARPKPSDASNGLFPRACMYLERTQRHDRRRPKRVAHALFVAVAAMMISPGSAFAADDLRLELNKLEPANTACQAYFVLEEKAGKPLQSLKTDLIIFGKDGGIAKRLIAEMGPIRSKKTSVKIFAIDVPCAEISGVLLNDVASCAPEATPEACLDRLAVSSRLNTRFYK